LTVAYRHVYLHDQRTATQAQLDELAAAIPDQDPSLLDELPYLTSQLHKAPADLVAGLLDTPDIQVLYQPEQHQATILATLTYPPPPQTWHKALCNRNWPRSCRPLSGWREQRGGLAWMRLCCRRWESALRL
jgi:hypothetical protein